MKNSIRMLAAFAATLPLSSPVPSASAAIERPPQFVLLAFDGSLNNSFWEESLTFAERNEIAFTYFASGVYFLLDKNKSLYTEPTHGVGRSAIGWGGPSAENLTNRMGYLRRAYAEGNEIGSHANGHFDGTAWTYDQWKLEFSQFPKLIFDAFANNGITPPAGFDLGFGTSEVKGFRAPLLGQGPALYQILAEEGFRYDTSKTAAMNYWPAKQKGSIWNFPLANVAIAGTAKRTISMDYNFYYAQSRGLPEKDPALQELYRKEMLQTYYNYFLNNYNGNRAPIHIGHHFSKWNGGAYWKAMQQFAQTVCKMPEVRCVTYSALTDWLDSRSPEELSAYAKGAFPAGNRAQIPPVLASATTLAASAAIDDANPGSLSVTVSGRDAAALATTPDLRVDWKLDGAYLGSGFRLSKTAVQEKAKTGASDLAVEFHSGDREILRTTHRISTDAADNLVIEGPDLEARALKGDLPEAHFDEATDE